MQPERDHPGEEGDDTTWEPTSPIAAAKADLCETRAAEPGVTTQCALPTPGSGVKSGSPSDSGGSGSDPFDTDEDPGGPAPPLVPGAVICEDYRLIEKLGAGGMGEVWLVYNMKLECDSALKVIKPEFAQNKQRWKRFEREAKLMAKLKNHPNAATVYHYDRRQGVGFIEMEYIQGSSLDRILKERGGHPMSVEEVAPILYQLCDLLQVAHSYVDERTKKKSKIIHRDLKPSNLMLVPNKPPGQNLKVLDFGVAKMTGLEELQDPQLTGAREIVGTPHYASPEQLNAGDGTDGNGRVDGRSDLYSVGVMFYQLLTGHLPFTGNWMAVVAAHLDPARAPQPLNASNPQANVPPAIERVILRCLEKNPDKRPQSARELALEFRAAVEESAHSLGQARSRPRPRGTKLTPARLGLLAVGSVACICTFWLMFAGLKKATPKSVAGKSGQLSSTTPDDVPPSVAAWTADAVPRDFPEDYVGEDPDDIVNQAPRVIIRLKEKDSPERSRYIRIPGKAYLCGDSRRRDPAQENDRSPCAHWVKVRDFYIQETEVTNGEIEDYLTSGHPEDQNSLMTWKQLFDLVKERDPAGARRYPACGIGHEMAQKYAESMGGRLPTEAEWELAAKSGHDDFMWVWGNKRQPVGQRWAAFFDPNSHGPTPVKTFGTKDVTEQGVFDLTANVREWCLDAYRPYSETIPVGNDRNQPLLDTPQIVTAHSYVVRGGSFQLDDPIEATTFHRKAMAPDTVLDELGFRVVIPAPEDLKPRVAHRELAPEGPGVPPRPGVPAARSTRSLVPTKK